MSNVTEDSPGALPGPVDRADQPGTPGDRSGAGGDRLVTGTRVRWLPLVAVLAAMAVAVGGGVLAAAWLTASRHPGPTMERGRAAPVQETGSVGVPTRPPPASTSPEPSGPGLSRPAAPGRSAPAGTEVAVGPLRLTLPAGWAVARRDTGEGRTTACLEKVPTAGSCDIWVTAVDDPTTGGMSVDEFAGMMTLETGLCPVGAGGGELETTGYTVRTLGDRPAEYRAYRRVCGGAVQRPEQWTVPTWPAVQVSALDLRPAARDDVPAIVAGARFTEPDTGRRVTDVGLLTGHSRDAGGSVHVRLNRTVWVAGGVNNGHDMDENPATYDYRLAQSVTIRDSGQ